MHKVKMQKSKIQGLSLTLSISPLSLALGDHLQADPLAHLLELGLAQRLGENVS
jgi:hypothetical protein